MFQKDPAAVADFLELVTAALRKDAVCRAELKRRAVREIVRGLVLFVGGGTLFGLYCWFASWAPPPQPGHWIRWFGWLLHGLLLVLLGAVLAGPAVAGLGWRQWLRVRRLERRATRGDEAATPR